MSYIKIFIQVVDEFFTELIEIFPEENKIKVQYTLFQTIIKANAKKPCTDFMIGSIPYLEKVALRDEDFFIGENKPAILEALNIKNVWTPDLSQVTKNAIWKYIQSFFIIGVKIVEMPPETHNLLNYIIQQKMNKN
jgi:hypothetical protein